jgi:hypothetical protein
MCTGAILLYRIPRVVIGENSNFKGEGEAYLRSRGVEVVVVDDERCKETMARWIGENPEVRVVCGVPCTVYRVPCGFYGLSLRMPGTNKRLFLDMERGYWGALKREVVVVERDQGAE